MYVLGLLFSNTASVKVANRHDSSHKLCTYKIWYIFMFEHIKCFCINVILDELTRASLSTSTIIDYGTHLL